MDLKIVSGVLITRGRVEGRSIIDFSRNEIVGGDLEPSKLGARVTIAPTTPVDLRLSYFDQAPCNTVALREIKSFFIDYDNLGSRPPIAQISQQVINSTADKMRLTISWKSTRGSEIEEISYLAIGPVSPQQPGPY